MDGCRRWCITALATDSMQLESLEPAAVRGRTVIPSRMFAYSKQGRIARGHCVYTDLCTVPQLFLGSSFWSSPFQDA